MMEWWQENDSPLGPSVHGGAIPGNLGGKAAEPIFRAQGLDEALGISGILYAEDVGAKTVVIFATQVEGFQLAADAAEEAAGSVGIQVLAAHRRSGRAAVLPGRGPEDRRPEARRRHRPGGIVESATLIKEAQRQPEPVAQLDRRDRLDQKRVHQYAGHRADRRRRRASASPRSPSTRRPRRGTSSRRCGTRRSPSVAETARAVPLLDLRPDGPDGPGRRGRRVATRQATGRRRCSRSATRRGDVCYTYADCLKLIREGKDIDYEGVTGPGQYSDGGVNAVIQAYTRSTRTARRGSPSPRRRRRALESPRADQDRGEVRPGQPPNVCTWCGEARLTPIETGVLPPIGWRAPSSLTATSPALDAAQGRGWPDRPSIQ